MSELEEVPSHRIYQVWVNQPHFLSVHVAVYLVLLENEGLV